MLGGWPNNYSNIYSHPQIDGKVNHHWISRDFLSHLFGDDYRYAISIDCPVPNLGRSNVIPFESRPIRTWRHTPKGRQSASDIHKISLSDTVIDIVSMKQYLTYQQIEAYESTVLPQLRKALDFSGWIHCLTESYASVSQNHQYSQIPVEIHRKSSKIRTKPIEIT